MDAVVKAAAPADFYVVNSCDHKIKKKSDTIRWSLRRIRISSRLWAAGKRDRFSWVLPPRRESGNLRQREDRRKNLDMIVANDVSAPGAGFDVDTNIFTLITADGRKRNTKR